MKKALKILVLVFVISVLAMTVVACDVDCPNGHTWDGGTVTKQPTCTEAGERTYTCAVCGTTRTAAVEALGHSYNYVPEVPADCKTAGTAAHYTCSRCDKLFVSQNGEMKEVTASELVVTADHSWDSGIVTKYPTCTEAGEKTYTCLSCGETKTEAVAATGHDYGEEIAEVPATCTTSGTAAHYECTNCHKLFVDAEGEKTQVTVAEITLSLAHSFDDGVVTTQPTCQATGIKTYTCSACHATHTELVPATGHDYGDEIAEVPATCTKTGTAAHYQCASCGKLFVDDNGVKKEVAANELVIALVAHSYDEGTVTTQPTCEKNGVKTFACTACGHTYTENVSATGHNYGDEIAEVAATCTATGTKAHYECANCGKLFVDVNGRKIQVTENYLTIALVPHTVVTDEAVEPTCTATGLTKGSHCSVCGTVIVAQTEISANGHSYGELIAEVAATCEAAGTKAHYECAVCGKYFVDVEDEKTEVTAEELAIEKLAHTVVVDEAVEPTCTATGLTQGSHCSVCGEVIVAQEVLAANGHTEEVIAGTPATCTETGLTEGKRCSVCGEILTEQQVIPVAEHKSVVVYDNGGHWTECETCRQVLSEKVLHEWKVSEQVAPTCTQKGSVIETCTCGATRSTVVSATGHTVTKVEATPATCEHEGNVEYYKCVNDNCGALFLKVGDDYVPTTIEEVTLPKAHTYGELIAEKEATCTEAGTAAHYECSTCHTLFVDKDGVKTEVTEEELVIAAKGHSYGEWTLTKDPTQTETGGAKRTCTVCGDEETTVVPVLTDTTVWTVETHPSTCTQAGTSTYTSQYGTVVVTLELAAHTEEVMPAVEPTCTETGLTEGKKCSVCGEILEEQQIVSAKGHQYDDGVVTTRPTCTDKGVKTFTCTVCDATKTEEVAELGHDIVHHEAKTPTCTEKGWEAYDTCSRCDYTTYKEIEAKGHTEEVIAGTPATCTETGLTEGKKCSVCGEILEAQKEIPAKGHDYGELITEVAATCTATGTKAHYKCSVCYALFVDENGEKTQVTADDLAIPATGHTYNAAETHSNKCVNCDNEITFEEIVAIIKGLDHNEGTTDTYLLKGEVTRLDDRGNPYITVEGTSDTVWCYYLHEGTHDGFTYYPEDLDIGYTITVVGPLKKYNSNLEIDNGNLIGAISPQRTVTLEAVTNGTVDVVGEGSFPSTAHDGDKISFTVTANDGYKVASVTVNGTAITADADGTYTATVNGDTTIKVEIVEDSVVVPEAELVLTLTAETMDMNSDSYADNNGDHVVGEYTVTSNQVYQKGGGTDLQWQRNKGSLTLTGTFCKVIINYTEGSYTLTVNNTLYSGTTANGQIIFDFGSDITGEYIIKVGNALGYVSSIEFYAMPACAHEVDNWSSNNDGTHTGTCSLCGETVTEDCTFVDEVCEVCGGNQPVYAINTSVENATIATPTGDLPVTALHGTELAFTVTPAEGFVVTEVKVNGETVEAVEGVYTITVKATVNIEVTTQEESTVPAEPTEFVKITDQNTFENAVASGAKFLIVYEDGNTAYVFDGSLTKLDAANNYVTATIENGQIADSAELQASSFAITASASGYNIQSASGYYIGPSSSNGMLSNISIKYDNSISFSSSNVIIKGTATTIKFNNASNQMRFRYYKSGQKSVCLYALI